MKTLMAETSLEAFINILPKICERQELVLRHLYFVGNASNTMISASIKLPINCVTGRTNELRKKKLVVEYKKEICPVTGQRVIFWELTPKGIEVIKFKDRQKNEN